MEVRIDFSTLQVSLLEVENSVVLDNLTIG
jgi:hypothetical protein